MRLPLGVRAFFAAVAFVARRQPLFAAFVGFLIIILLPAMLLALFSPPPPPMTAQQLQEYNRQQEEQKQKDEQRHEATERTKEACALKPVCAKYGEVRQACAVAGSYKNCLMIKMGDDVQEIGNCTDDGKVATSEIPTSVDCFLAGW